ncbi:MAG: hypothetical protein RL497_87 [Pseudomonadota bacterium]
MKSELNFPTLRHRSSCTRRVLSGFLAFLILFQSCTQAVYAASYSVSDADVVRLLSSDPELHRVAQKLNLYTRAEYLMAEPTSSATNLASFYERLKNTSLIQGSSNLGKLVGDDFVQNRIIRSQIHIQLGRHIIEPGKYPGADINRQMEILQNNELYENAFQFAAKNPTKVIFGNRLPADLMSEKDLIWPEYRQIDKEIVLVPVLYLSDATIKKQMVKGNVLEFNSTVTFSDIKLDKTTLQAKRYAFIQASNDIIVNQGSILGEDKLKLLAGNDFINFSGTVKAASDISIAASNIENKTLLIPFRDKNGSGHRLGEIARIETNGNINLRAVSDITFTGSSASANGGITFEAGGDIAILAAKVDNTANETWAGQNRINQSQLDLYQSRLSATDTISLSAAGQITISGSELYSSAGGIELLAKQGIYVLDELGNTKVTMSDTIGKTTSQMSDFQQYAVRSVLKAGKGIILNTSAGGITLKGAKIESTDGTQVTSNSGKVKLLIAKEHSEYQYQLTKKSFWTIKTQTDTSIKETPIYNSILGGFAVNALDGIEIEYGGKEGVEIQDQIKQLSQFKDLEWVSNLNNDPDIRARIDWTEVKLAYEEIHKRDTNLSPAAMAIIAIAVATAMGPMAAGLTGPSGSIGAVTLNGTQLISAGAMQSAAVTMVTTAAQNLAAGKTPSEAMKAMAQSVDLKGLVINTLTLGAIQSLGLDGFQLFTVAGEGFKTDAINLINQSVNSLGKAAIKSSLKVAIDNKSDGFLKEFNKSFKEYAANSLNQYVDIQISGVKQWVGPELGVFAKEGKLISTIISTEVERAIRLGAKVLVDGRSIEDFKTEFATTSAQGFAAYLSSKIDSKFNEEKAEANNKEATKFINSALKSALKNITEAGKTAIEDPNKNGDVFWNQLALNVKKDAIATLGDHFSKKIDALSSGPEPKIDQAVRFITQVSLGCLQDIAIGGIDPEIKAKRTNYGETCGQKAALVAGDYLSGQYVEANLTPQQKELAEWLRAKGIYSEEEFGKKTTAEKDALIEQLGTISITRAELDQLLAKGVHLANLSSAVLALGFSLTPSFHSDYTDASNRLSALVFNASYNLANSIDSYAKFKVMDGFIEKYKSTSAAEKDALLIQFALSEKIAPSIVFLEGYKGKFLIDRVLELASIYGYGKENIDHLKKIKD